jgi:D-alanyl-lipoteichoic acid acyltransferase DltB (MBOAT superfamily)
MNYNSWSFWLLFAIVIVRYWKLDHRKQNDLLLVASYFFYGFWDYRFTFLILISTVIDFIGGLGVAGVRLPPIRIRRLGVLVTASSLFLCSNIHYRQLIEGLQRLNFSQMLDALPVTISNLRIPIAVAVLCLLYGRALPGLYSLPEARRRKYFLVISLAANLGILGFFKYCDFFIDTFRSLAITLGFGEPSWTTLGILLPAGISFYTFQAMSYTIDIYRGKVRPTDHFRDFALFVCFFPHLVAGPIMRAHTLLPQVVSARSLRPGAFEEGLYLVLIGLFKKIVIADNMAGIVNYVFNRFQAGDTAGITGAEVIVAVYAFAFQIYGDFSGYSSIARGISKWLGFDLVINFNMPYLAVSPSDFWQRWHISLSSWLRDYLYIPLGGNRGGNLMTYRNLMITMLLGGLWHGASWTFVAWGLYQGAILCLFRLLNVSDRIPGDGWRAVMHRAWRMLLMFHLTCAGWLLFRADSFQTLARMCRLIANDMTVTPLVLATLVMIAFYCSLMFVLEYLLEGEHKPIRLLGAGWQVRAPVYGYLLLMLVIFRSSENHEFIYFQF